MKRLLFAAAVTLSPVWANAQTDAQNVLFVGNSLTYFYGMPTTFSQMANAAGDKVVVSQHTEGNTGFVHHVNNPELYALIRSKTWDYVILQPGSYESYGEPSVQVVNGYLSRMKDSIYRYSPCAQVILYEISNGITGHTNTHKQDYSNIQSRMLRTIQSLSDAGEVSMAPAGEVLRHLYMNLDMMLWEGIGDIHPNAYGAYAITCAMYNTIFKKKVAGMPLAPLRWASDLNAEQCAVIQQVSDSIVLETPAADWRRGTYQPDARFFVPPFSSNIVSLINYSVNYDRLIWEFADGTTSTEENPTKELFANGDRERVILKAYKGDCFNMYARTIDKNADATGIDRQADDLSSIRIYPNPAKDRIFIQYNRETDIRQVDITLYDMAGRSVRTVHTDRPGKSLDTNLDLSGLPEGIYLLLLQADGNQLQHKLIVQ